MDTANITKDYNRIYSTSGLRTHTKHYKQIVGLLGPVSNSKILDVACGEGILLRELEKLNKGIETYGIDISDVGVDIAHRNSPKSKIIVADGQKIPFPDKFFDYLICLGSLEHYLDPDLGVREQVRVAKDGAKFCILLPNSISIDLFLHVLRTGEKPPENFQIIERTATKNEWVNLLSRNGLSVKAVYGSNLWPELFEEGSCKIKSLSKYFRRLLIKYFCPLNLARDFVFICTKKGK